MNERGQGSIEERKGRLYVRLPIPGRPRVRLDPGTTREEAEQIRKVIIGEFQRTGAPPKTITIRPAKSETFRAYAKRWVEDRKARKLSSARDDLARLSNYAFEAIGDKGMREITKRDLEELVEKLDETARSGARSAKTMRNIWAVICTLFDDASASKTLSLRVLDANPAAGVRGPDASAKKAKVYLFPSEADRLLACEDIPVRWRRAYALGLYLGTRYGELAVLLCEDVVLDGGYVHVHKALAKDGTVKSTKAKDKRKIPIEPNLRPLLEALIEEAGSPSARLVVLPPPLKMASTLREHLKLARLERADLFARDEERKPLGYHDLRGTTATWCALRGDDPLKIKQRLGHRDFTTTAGYIREAEAVGRGDIGTPFSAIPASLLGAHAAEQATAEPAPEPASEATVHESVHASVHVKSETVEIEPKRGPPTAALVVEKQDLNPTFCEVFSGNIESQAHFSSDTPGEPHNHGAPFVHPLDRALAVALEAAASAGQWGVVSQLARELEARRAAPCSDAPLAQSTSTSSGQERSVVNKKPQSKT